MIICYDWCMPNVTEDDLAVLRRGMAYLTGMPVKLEDDRPAVAFDPKTAELPAGVRQRYNTAVHKMFLAIKEIEEISTGTWTAARIDGKCSWCLDPMTVPDRTQGGGRTKRFCSSNCRVAFHRWSMNASPTNDRMAWLKRNRAGLDSIEEE